MGVGGERHAPVAYPGKEPGPLAQEAQRDLGPVMTGTENLASDIFEPRTVKTVASRHSEYDIPAAKFVLYVTPNVVHMAKCRIKVVPR
jgi:hypothetical protein